VPAEIHGPFGKQHIAQRATAEDTADHPFYDAPFYKSLDIEWDFDVRCAFFKCID